MVNASKSKKKTEHKASIYVKSPGWPASKANLAERNSMTSKTVYSPIWLLLAVPDVWPKEGGVAQIVWSNQNPAQDSLQTGEPPRSSPNAIWWPH